MVSPAVIMVVWELAAARSHATNACKDLGASSVKIEYSTCIDVPNALMSAIKFTSISEVFVLALFFFTYTAYKRGIGSLLISSTYMDLWSNVKHDSDTEEGEVEDFSNIESTSELAVAVTEDISELKDIVSHPLHILPHSANHVFATAAPRSTIKFDLDKEKCLSLLFIIWFVGSSCAMFSSLFWYFYTNSCVVSTVVSDNSQNEDFYSNLYLESASTGVYFCSSKLQSQFLNPAQQFTYIQQYTLECLLPGMTPDNFASHSACPESNIKGTDAFQEQLGFSCCNQTFYVSNLGICAYACKGDNFPVPTTVYSLNNFNTWAKGVRQPDGNTINSPISAEPVYCTSDTFTYGGAYPTTITNKGATVSITYVKCSPISSTLATSVQYTLFAQSLLIAVFLLYRKVQKKGCSVLIKFKTYENLLETASDALFD
jgi:hypothetical protein